MLPLFHVAVLLTGQAGLALMGGGPDLNDAFRFLVDRAAGGNFVILRASGDDSYNAYVQGLGKLAPVETLVAGDRASASDPAIVNKVRHAQALFIAGGDQWNYVKFWKDTPLAAAIQELADRGTPIGGTSAGLAIMGQFYFSAEFDSALSPKSLADPYDRRIRLGRDFLKLSHMRGTITDSHFVKRDRLGRTVAFLARILQEKWADPALGMGVDESAAVLMDGAGMATVVGKGAVYFFKATGLPGKCEPGVPLTLENIQVYRAPPGGTFDLAHWRGTGGTAYTISAVAGRLRSTQAGGSVY